MISEAAESSEKIQESNDSILADKSEDQHQSEDLTTERVLCRDDNIGSSGADEETSKATRRKDKRRKSR